MSQYEPLPGLALGGHPTWQNPELPQLHKLPARATFWPFPTADAARARVPDPSPLVRCPHDEGVQC